MHGKLAARLAQTIHRQQLQHFFPRHVPAFVAELPTAPASQERGNQRQKI
jgi:hypothetical protein